MDNIKNRRTIITLDTKDNKIIPVFIVMEKLFSDMQDYDFKPINKRPNSYDKKKDNLSLSIEEFDANDPFMLNGNFVQMKRLGEYVSEPDGGLRMLLPSIGESLNTLADVLPKRQCPLEVSCLIDKDRMVWNRISQEKRLMTQLKKLSLDNLGVDLSLYPEHIGNLYTVTYNPYFKKISFRASKNPNGLMGEIVFRKGCAQPLKINIKDEHSGYLIYAVNHELTGKEHNFFIETPLFPRRLSIEILNKEGKTIMLEKNVSFLKGIVFEMGVQKLELKLRKQGKKQKDNYEVSIPKYEKESKSYVGERSDDNYSDYFMIADSLSRQKADEKALNFIFFDGDPNKTEENVRYAKEAVRKMISRGRNVCYICDPYFNADDFVEYVYYIRNLDLDIRIVVCKSPNDNAVEYQKRLDALAKTTNEYNILMGRNIVEVRSLKSISFHDRFVYADKTGWLLGSSFSEFGHRMTTISKIPKSHSQIILDRIEGWWNDNSKSKKI